jgi:hypothetical protein
MPSGYGPSAFRLPDQHRKTAAEYHLPPENSHN